jgi:hypothetical protein
MRGTTEVMAISEAYLRVCENNDWTVTGVDEDRVELEKYSPAGEDFSFVTNMEDFVDGVKEYAADFNIDGHIEMWIAARASGTAGIPSARELVHDAEAIDKMLQELAAALARAEETEEWEGSGQ